MDAAAEIAESIDRRLMESGSPERAMHERAYLKSELVHYGTPIPTIRRTVKEALKESGAIDHDTLLSLVDILWRPPVHERRMAAVEVLCARVRSLTIDDVATLESLIRQARTWAIVDPLAIKVAGPLLDTHPEVLDRWASDDDFWVRRSALLAHLEGLRSQGGDWQRFIRYADGMLECKEFFIRKAIGWVMRETARKRPQMVAEWMLPRAHRSSGVTVREVVKYLDPEDAAEITRRQKEGRR
jgi:3-methyladenine DNA glycosylase AlkD